MQAVVVDPSAPGRLVLRPVEAPAPGPAEALVQVAAVSLNPGELRRAMDAQAGWRPGWDLAGTIEQAAADGSGPPVGTRVVGIVDSGAWGELVAVRTDALAELPATVSFAQAATLPVAGLTALRALERSGALLSRAVLITGASGGVGHFACQLARQSGARVVGVVRRPDREAVVHEAGAHHVVVSDDVQAAGGFGPYHLILESIGSRALGAALTLLAPGGVCVSFGASAGTEVTFDARRFYLVGGASLYGFILFYELARTPAAEDLSQLAGMVAEGRLRPQIDVEASWTDVAAVAAQLLDRRVIGKAVLQVSG